MIYVQCDECGSEGETDIEPLMMPGVLACPECGEPVVNVDIGNYADWVESRVAEKARMQARGMGTRKQAGNRSDTDIDRDGLAAELAAALILFPGKVAEYMAMPLTGNRGRDFPTSLTGLPLPVEVKQTRHRSDKTGCLILRPPRMTPGHMRLEYLDDSIYLLLHGQPFRYSVLGWIDREGLIRDGKANPVPVRPGQRETWGCHWSKLRPLAELAERIGTVKTPRITAKAG